MIAPHSETSVNSRHPLDGKPTLTSAEARPRPRRRVGSPETGFWEVGMAEARNSNPEENQGGRSNVGAERGTLERNLLSALASRLVEGTLTFIDGIGGFRGFGGFRTVPVL